MPTNVLLQNSYGAGLEDRRRNALLDQQMQAQEQAMQQQGAMQPLQMAQARANLDATRQNTQLRGQQNALGMLTTSLRSVLGSPDILGAARQLTASPDFQKQIQLLGGDPAQFSIDGTDTPQSVAGEIQQFLSSLEGSQPNQNNVARTFVGDNGNMWAVMQDSSVRDTGVPVQSNYQFIDDPAMGRVAVNRSNPTQGQVLVTPEQQTQGLVTRQQEQARGEAAVQAELAAPQREQAIQQSLANVETTLSLLDDALGGVNAWTAGPIGTVLENIAGTPAADLQATVDTIVANLSFDRLQQMRESSKTGGALGAISERELTLLGAAVANLSNAQSPAQQIRNLRLVREHYGNIRNQMQQNLNEQRQIQGLPAQQQGSTGPAQIQDDAGYDALPSGTQFVGPDGVLRVKP